MNFKLETEFSKAELLHNVDALKKQIDDMRTLSADVEGRIMQKLRLDWNYHSNAIEGNRLTYGETVAFLMEGITAKGKPLKDHLDIRGHNEAINFLLDVVKDTRPLSEIDIRNLHKMILVEPYTTKAQTAEGLPTTKQITLGEYKTSPNHVKTSTGETHYYAAPEETPAKMQELMAWFGEAIDSKDIHPAVTAALFHHKFVSVHPFDDGNGRLSRILMNLVLMKKGFPPVVVKMGDRQNYYALLSRADNNDSWPFIEYIAEHLQRSLQWYLKAAKGGDIDEEEDIDKEIALFKMELKDEVNLREKKSYVSIIKVVETIIYPLFQKITVKANEFDEFFFQTEKILEIEIPNDFGVGSWKIDFNDTRIHPKFPNADFNVVSYHCDFKEFKNSKRPHNLRLTWKINFDTYNYTISDTSTEKILSKYYDESLSKTEQNLVVKKFIKELQLSIKSIL